MLHLGLLIGTGHLYVNGKYVGVVTYSLSVWRQGEAIGGNGVLSGNALGIETAHMQGVGDLELETGERITIHVHEANMMRGLYTVSGAIPGFPRAE